MHAMNENAKVAVAVYQALNTALLVSGFAHEAIGLKLNLDGEVPNSVELPGVLICRVGEGRIFLHTISEEPESEVRLVGDFGSVDDAAIEVAKRLLESRIVASLVQLQVVERRVADAS